MLWRGSLTHMLADGRPINDSNQTLLPNALSIAKILRQRRAARLLEQKDENDSHAVSRLERTKAVQGEPGCRYLIQFMATKGPRDPEVFRWPQAEGDDWTAERVAAAEEDAALAAKYPSRYHPLID